MNLHKTALHSCVTPNKYKMYFYTLYILTIGLVLICYLKGNTTGNFTRVLNYTRYKETLIKTSPDTYEKRISDMRDFCQKRGPCTLYKHDCALHEPAILVNDKYKVLWCDMPKVASTTIKWGLFQLSGKKDKWVNFHKIHTISEMNRHGLRRINQYSKKQQKKILKTYYKFIFVRHPLVHLVSAYADKFGNLKEGYYRKLSISMMKVTRRLEQFKAIKEPHMTFPEFVWFVTRVPEAQFRNDAHWHSIEHRCSPCTIHYDFIGRLETFSTDYKQLMKLAFNVKIKPEKKKKTTSRDKRRDHATNSTDDKTRKRLSILSNETKQALFDLYGRETEMFGYNWGLLMQ